ncbi:15582_t:CDS:2, partial [Funneliformis geosporum]
APDLGSGAEKQEHYLLRHIKQDNPALSFIPKFLSLSKPLPLVQKIKISFSLTTPRIYLGSGQIFHLEYPYSATGERNNDDDLYSLLAYRSLIPYKNPHKVLVQIARLVLSDSADYNLFFRNCEHLVNKVIYGINYSPQVQC